MDTCISNYINGNLKDAKEQAKKFSYTKLKDCLITWGYSLNHADAIAKYLKGNLGWNELNNYLYNIKAI